MQKKIPPSAARPCEKEWIVEESNKQILVWYHPFNEPPKWQPETFEQVHDKDWTDYKKYEWIVHGPVQKYGGKWS